MIGTAHLFSFAAHGDMTGKGKASRTAQLILSKIPSDLFIGALQGFDEDDTIVRVRLLRVKTLDSDWHLDVRLLQAGSPDTKGKERKVQMPTVLNKREQVYHGSIWICQEGELWLGLDESVNRDEGEQATPTPPRASFYLKFNSATNARVLVPRTSAVLPEVPPGLTAA